MPNPQERAFIKTIGIDAAEGELARLYDQVKDPVSGELDAIMEVHALHPAGLAAHFGLYRAAMAGTSGLSVVEREMIALVVSKLNDCHY